MNMKKLLYVLLAALLLVTLVACSGEEEDNGNAFDDYRDQQVEVTDWTDKAKNTFYFEAVDSESIAITGFSSTNYQPHEVKIPAYIDNRKVVAICDEAFANNASIQSLILPKASDYRNGVPAFTVGDNAFRGCVALNAISFPSYVKSIGENAFYGCESVASVTFEAGCSMTEIPANAFSGCSALKSLSIPAGVKSIGSAAFFECSSLETLTIAEGLTTIGKQAFQNCSALTRIDAPASITEVGAHAFAGCDAVEFASVPTWIIEPLNKTNLVSVTLVAGDSIPASAFKSCDKLESITIACELSSIGESAFVGCKSLKRIEIPETVTEIGRSMFKNCSALTEIVIPDAVTKIGASAFNGCSSLEKLNIPASVTEIGDQAFASCYAIKTITVADGNPVYKSVDNVLYNKDVTVLMQYAVGNDATVLTIPTTVTEIKASAFAGATQLTTLTIPNSVKNIGKYAFDGCVNVTDVTLPVGAVAAVAKDGLVNVVITEGTSIAANAFAGCVNLETVTLVDTITSVGASAFKGCSKLNTIVLPAGISEIGESVFEGCAALSGIVIPENVTAIGKNAFRGCVALTEVSIPKKVATIGLGAFADCSALTAFTVDAANTAFAANNGSLYNKGITEIIQYPIAREDAALALPKTVTKIAEGAYLGAINLKELIIPATVTEIGADAFGGCTAITHASVPTWALGKFATDGLTNLIVTGGTEIGKGALANSAKLESVEIPATVTSVDESAFEGCTAITHADVPAHALSAIPMEALVSVIVSGGEEIAEGIFKGAAALTSVSIPESVTKIGDEAFSGCAKLEAIILHEGITEIGEDAFYDCTALTSIALPASLETLGETAFGRTTSLTSVTVADGNEAFKAVDNVLYSADGKTLILYAVAQKQHSFVIPAGVEEVAANAFYGAANLVCIEVGADVKEFGLAVFSNCTKLIDIKNLSSLNIQPGRGNGNIANNADKNLINIYGADGQTKVAVLDDTQGSIIFASGDVTMLMGYTGDATSIKIDGEITEIAAGAFKGTAMTEITFEGTKDEWDDLKKGKNWNGGIESYTVHCTDGDIVVAPEIEEAPAA